MDLHLKGDTAVVVGAARGIGSAIARAFAEEGADVALIDRAAEVTATAKALAGVRASAWVCDATDAEALRRSAEQIVHEHGRVDHVVFAVAIGSGKFGFPFWNLTPADWPRVLEVNVVGAVNVLPAFTPPLVARQTGTVLLIWSVRGQI